MILSAHQPAYLPWLGYFDKIKKSDIFVFLDTVQFEKNSFTNRNKIKTPQGTMWLTVPVKMKGHLGKSLLEIEIDVSQDWRKKHLNAVFLNYKKAYNFDVCYRKLEVLYKKHHTLLVDLCWDHLMFWLGELRITTPVVKSSDLAVEAKKSDLILNLCSHFGANHYISGALGKNYLQLDDFSRHNIYVDFQDYQHPHYQQLWGDFLPCLSILDFWMNTNDYNNFGQREK